MSDIGYDRGVIEKILSHIREDNPDLIPIWTLKGKLSYIDMDLVIDDNGWRFDIDGAITNCTLRRCIAIGSGCLISIGDNTSDITKRNPASLLRQLQNRIDKSKYQRNEIKSRLKDIDSILAELQKSDSPNVVYKRIGLAFLISDSDKLIEEYKMKKEDANMHLKFIIQQEKRSNIRLRNANKAIFGK